MRALLTIVMAWAWLGCASNPSARPTTPPASVSSTAQSDALAARGLELLERGDYVRAEQYMLVALRAGHDADALIVPLLCSCIASNRLRSALSHAERYLARHPQAWHVRYVKAAIHRALDQPLLAQDELTRVLAAVPSALDARERAWLAQRRADASTASRGARPIRVRRASR